MPISKKTKRTFFITAMVAFGLPVLAVLILLLRLGPAICVGVKRVGPRLLGVETRLDQAAVSLWKGKMQLSGLEVANPEGFSSDTFLKADLIHVEANIAALRRNEIHVREIVLVSPEITIERTAHGSNVEILLERLGKDNDEHEGREHEENQETPEPPRLKVDMFRVTDAKVRLVLYGNEVIATLASVEMRDLQDADGNGLPMREVVRRFVTRIANDVKGFADISEGMERFTDDLRIELRRKPAFKELEGAHVE